MHLVLVILYPGSWISFAIRKYAHETKIKIFYMFMCDENAVTATRTQKVIWEVVYNSVTLIYTAIVLFTLWILYEVFSKLAQVLIYLYVLL